MSKTARNAMIERSKFILVKAGWLIGREETILSAIRTNRGGGFERKFMSPGKMVEHTRPAPKSDLMHDAEKRQVDLYRGR